MRDLHEETCFMIECHVCEVGAEVEETAEHRVCSIAWQTR